MSRWGEKETEPKGNGSIADQLGIKLTVKHLELIDDKTAEFIEANKDTFNKAIKELALEVEPLNALMIGASPYFTETMERILHFGIFLGMVKCVDSIKQIGFEQALDLIIKE